MKILKITLISTGVLAALFTILMLSGYSEGYCYFWPSIDTQYAADYSEGDFNRLNVGMSRADAETIMCSPLAAAMHGGHCEASRLLLATGATTIRIIPQTIFKSSNPEILGVCAEAGLDLSTGMSLARELVCQSEVALRFFERWHAESEWVADQGAVALIRAVRKDQEWWLKRRRGASRRTE
jgi:hypothetical protein